MTALHSVLRSSTALTIGFFLLAALLAPLPARAANFESGLMIGAGLGVGGTLLAQTLANGTGIGMAADAMCDPVIPTCPCGFINGPKGPCTVNAGPMANKFKCPPAPNICSDTTAGSLTVGTCVLPNKCLGISTSMGGSSMGLGGSLGGIVGQLLSGILQKLMQPKPPEPPTTPPYPTTPGELQCSISASVATSTATSTSYALSWLSNGKSATISPNVVPVVKPGDILDVPYYCITQTNPIVVVPVPAGTPFPKNCVNGSSIPSSGSRQVVAPALTTFFLTVFGNDGMSNTCSSAQSSQYSNMYGPTNNSISALLGGQTPTSQLLTQLGGPEPTANPVSQMLTQFQFPTNASATTTPRPTTTPTNTNKNVFAPTTPLTQGIYTQQGGMRPAGATGDIVVLDNGATIIVGTNDPDKNSQTVGFLGTNTFGGENPTGLVGQLCQNRPWASNFLSYVVPATFFDGLCSWRGYQVGLPIATSTPQVTVTQSEPRPVQVTTPPASTTPVQTVESKVDVWAVPASVPLGARTSVFWNTQGVASCTISSPDGSFNQSTLSGGASTVPLTTATTYTISCLKADGSPITDYVTVNIAI